MTTHNNGARSRGGHQQRVILSRPLPPPPPLTRTTSHGFLLDTTTNNYRGMEKHGLSDFDRFYSAITTIHVHDTGSVGERRDPRMTKREGGGSAAPPPSWSTTDVEDKGIVSDRPQQARMMATRSHSDLARMKTEYSLPLPPVEREGHSYTRRRSSLLRMTRKKDQILHQENQECPLTIPHRTSSVKHAAKSERGGTRGGWRPGRWGEEKRRDPPTVGVVNVPRRQRSGPLFSSLDGALALNHSRSTPALRSDALTTAPIGLATSTAESKEIDSAPSTEQRQQKEEENPLSSTPDMEIPPILRTTSAQSHRSNTTTSYSLFPRPQVGSHPRDHRHQQHPQEPNNPSVSSSSSISSSSSSSSVTLQEKTDTTSTHPLPSLHRSPSGFSGFWKSVVPGRKRAERWEVGEKSGLVVTASGGICSGSSEDEKRPGSSWTCLGFLRQS